MFYWMMWLILAQINGQFPRTSVTTLPRKKCYSIENWKKQWITMDRKMKSFKMFLETLFGIQNDVPLI